VLIPQPTCMPQVCETYYSATIGNADGRRIPNNAAANGQRIHSC
jgi:hypothetical protein